jgi:hypothetical protein
VDQSKSGTGKPAENPTSCESWRPQPRDDGKGKPVDYPPFNSKAGKALRRKLERD